MILQDFRTFHTNTIDILNDTRPCQLLSNTKNKCLDKSHYVVTVICPRRSPVDSLRKKCREWWNIIDLNRFILGLIHQFCLLWYSLCSSIITGADRLYTVDEVWDQVSTYVITGNIQNGSLQQKLFDLDIFCQDHIYMSYFDCFIGLQLVTYIYIYICPILIASLGCNWLCLVVVKSCGETYGRTAMQCDATNNTSNA